MSQTYFVICPAMRKFLTEIIEHFWVKEGTVCEPSSLGKKCAQKQY